MRMIIGLCVAIPIIVFWVLILISAANVSIFAFAIVLTFLIGWIVIH